MTATVFFLVATNHARLIWVGKTGVTQRHT